MNLNRRRYRFELEQDRFENRSAVLYSLHQNKYSRYSGIVSIDTEKKLGAVFYIDPTVKIASINVADQEGTIWNRTIWFYDQRDEEARTRLIEYEQQCILELQQRIKTHEQILNSLKGDFA